MVNYHIVVFQKYIFILTVSLSSHKPKSSIILWVAHYSGFCNVKRCFLGGEGWKLIQQQNLDPINTKSLSFFVIVWFSFIKSIENYWSISFFRACDCQKSSYILMSLSHICHSIHRIPVTKSSLLVLPTSSILTLELYLRNFAVKQVWNCFHVASESPIAE